ncbi:glycosyltransferase family 2 protein [Acinetobacter gerneri]|uniref:glycosyltransferase family 2 protein n=1 Tax=Acinetobacter gerneri TaxID=202952 RepID=UPI003211FE18
MQSQNQPLVSVIIPCYNHAQFIQDCIQSVIDQTYANIELIIIDDGSRDQSVEKIKEMLEKCKERFTRFEFKHRSNRGVSATLNEALECCEGEYITFLASDDIYHKDKVLKQTYFLINNSSVKFVISHSYVINDLNEILDLQTQNYNLDLTDEITFEDILTFKTHLPVTGMYSSELIKNKLKGFDPNITAEDYDIYLRISKITKIYVIQENLYYYRSPEALGEDRKRKPMRVDVSESHFNTIQKYKNNKNYSIAMNEWNFRRFIFFSSYKSTKIYALRGMFGSLNKVANLQFFRSLFKLVFIWK